VSGELRDLGWTAGTGNVPAAYLTGLLAGKRAAKGGVTRAILDLGVQRPAYGGRLFAATSGLVDAGVDVPHGEGVLPKKDRLEGKHLGDAVAKQFADVKAKLEAA
jgi:large subunit ribosomal protein L18